MGLGWALLVFLGFGLVLCFGAIIAIAIVANQKSISQAKGRFCAKRIQARVRSLCTSSPKLVYKFASEAPGAAGLWQKQALLLNTPAPEIIFDDLLAAGLGHRGPSTSTINNTIHAQRVPSNPNSEVLGWLSPSEACQADTLHTSFVQT